MSARAAGREAFSGAIFIARPIILNSIECCACRTKGDADLKTSLLVFGALISIVNPLSGAFIFFGATRELTQRVRGQVSRWVAIYAFSIGTASLYIGAYVLEFFGISIPVLRVAGGIVISMSGWHMLTEADATEQRRSETPGPRPVAISWGSSRPSGFSTALLEFVVATMLAVSLLALLIYVSYRHSARLAELIGATGTTIIVRLSAFLLFCIGIQVFWNGAAELLGTLPLGSAGAS